MALVTGTPLGSITSMEDIFIDGASTVYFQDSDASLAYNPDANGFYWGLSGTATYPVYELGCIQNIVVGENRENNSIQCDTDGFKGDIQQRNYITITFDLLSQLPLTILREIIGLSAVTQAGDTEQAGYGQINNTRYFHVYTAKVYDEDAGDYLARTFHKCQFVGEPQIEENYGAPWSITGIEIRAYVDSSMPAAQKFGSLLRSDQSVLNP